MSSRGSARLLGICQSYYGSIHSHMYIVNSRTCCCVSLCFFFVVYINNYCLAMIQNQMDYKLFMNSVLSVSCRPWLGVELDTPHGNNDGSIDGTSYFKSKSKHGIFVQQSEVVRFSEPHVVDTSKYLSSK